MIGVGGDAAPTDALQEEQSAYSSSAAVRSTWAAALPATALPPPPWRKPPQIMPDRQSPSASAKANTKPH